MYSNGAGNECRTGVDLLKTTIYTTAADVRQEFPGSSHMLNIPNGGCDQWPCILAHTAHLCSGHQMHRLLIWDQQRGTRHLLCPPSPMPPSQHQPSRRENISRLFVENIFKIRQRYVTPKVILFSLAHLELSESWNVLISRIFQQPSSLGRYYHHQASKPNHPKDYYSSSSRSQNIGECRLVTACGGGSHWRAGHDVTCHVSRVMMVRPWPFPPLLSSASHPQQSAYCKLCHRHHIHISRRIQQHGHHLGAERSIETFSFLLWSSGKDRQGMVIKRPLKTPERP